ncbi:MAG: autotransporter domain-containing protein [Hellea sp.]|nr:autotransporter domain-containing protein [Hellea sp.]
MSNFRKCLSPSIFAGLMMVASPASAGDDGPIALFDDLIVFGDSLSDPGNLPGLLNGLNIPGPPYFENQFSNGPVYTYLLDDLLGFQATRDLNYAIGGARSGPGVTQNNFGIDHVNAFLNGNGSGAQVDRFLASGYQISDFDLFVLNIGGNDYLGFDPMVDDPALVVSNAVGNIQTQLGQLIGAGADHILVPFVADTGLTPSVAVGGPAAMAASTAISDAHNAALTNMLSGLTTTTNTHIYTFDSTTLFRDVYNNPTKYGLSVVDVSCLGNFVICSNPEDYLFFDGVHPTAVGHQITAAAMADTLISTRIPGAAAEVSAEMAADWDHMLSLTSRTMKLSDQWSWFGQVHYLDGERDNQRLSSGYDYDGYAATFGGARQAGKFRLGVAGSYGVSETEYSMVNGGLDTDSVRVGGFASRDFNEITATVTGSLSFDAHDTARHTGVAGQISEGSAEGRTFMASGELRGNFIEMKDEAIGIHPFVRLTWQDTNIEGYAESGAAGLDRIIGDVTINPINAEAGLDIGGHFDDIFVGVQGSWVKGLENNSQTVTTALVTIPDVPVSITTLGTDDSYARVSAIAGINISENLSLTVIGSTDFARSDSDAVNGIVRLSGRF